MKISEIKSLLKTQKTLSFQLPDTSFVPAHFHITEVGISTKKFIDCGGVVREEQTVTFQLWVANDTDHRLKAEKLKKIIEIAEKKIELNDLEIEVEYQTDTIGKYFLGFNGKNFVLFSQRTNCLAQDKCGVPEEKLPSCCGDGCC